MYLQEIMRPHTGGEGGVGPSEKTTPCTPHTGPLLSTEQSATCSTTPLRPAKGATNAGQCTTNRVEERVEAGSDTNVDVEAAFPGSSRVTRTGSIVKTFLVNDDLIPINIEKIPGNYRLFKLVFII